VEARLATPRRYSCRGRLPYRIKSDPHSSHSVILARLGDGRGRKALDVGAADGFLAERLTAPGWSVTALERDPELAARARGRCKEVVVADLEAAIPRLQGPFDAIVYGDVLEHLSDPGAALRALDQTLAPEGSVIVSVPNVAHLWARLSLRARADYADRGILDRTPPLLPRAPLDLLRSAGLRGDSRSPVPLPGLSPRWHGRWLSRVRAERGGGWPGRLAYSSSRSAARGQLAGPPKGSAQGRGVMPAYNAGRTLRLTYEELPKDTVNLVILVDDGSTDATREVARDLGLEIFVDRTMAGASRRPATPRRSRRAPTSW
jgi:SAM-dependent methyltransferase